MLRMTLRNEQLKSVLSKRAQWRRQADTPEAGLCDSAIAALDLPVLPVDVHHLKQMRRVHAVINSSRRFAA
jgi:hypothetical protein